MTRHFYIALLFISLLGHSQVIILNNTNLNGFTNTGSATVAKFSNRIELSFPFNTPGTIDTTLNLVGYDSLKIIFTIRRGGNGSSTLNGIPTTYTPTTHTISTTNTTSLSLSYLILTTSGVHTLTVQDLKIIGYPSSSTSVTQNKAVENNEFIHFENKLIFKGKIKNQKLIVSDIVGRTIIEKDLDPINLLDFKSGVYLIRVIDTDKVIYTKKLRLDNY